MLQTTTTQGRFKNGRLDVLGPKDIEVSPGPNDGVSDLSFSPTSDFLASSSWDGQVKLSIGGFTSRLVFGKFNRVE